MESSLVTSALRIDVAGVPSVDGLTFATTGQHVILLGAPRVLFSTAAGVHSATRGLVSVAGLSPRAALRAGVAASAALDPALPPRWTARQLSEWSARLANHTRTVGKGLAVDALRRVGLSSLADTPIRSLPLAAKRGAVLAAALATGATTLLVDWSAQGLVEPQARALARIFASAMADRNTVVFAERMSLDSPLALASDEAIVIDGSDVLAQDIPAEIASHTRSLQLRVAGRVDDFVRTLEASGGRAERGATAARTERLRVDLGPLTTGDLFRIATESRAVVFELRPMSDVFA